MLLRKGFDYTASLQSWRKRVGISSAGLAAEVGCGRVANHPIRLIKEAAEVALKGVTPAP